MSHVAFTVLKFVVYTGRPYKGCLATRDGGIVVVAGSIYSPNIHRIHRQAV